LCPPFKLVLEEGVFVLPDMMRFMSSVSVVAEEIIGGLLAYPCVLDHGFQKEGINLNRIIRQLLSAATGKGCQERSLQAVEMLIPDAALALHLSLPVHN